MIDQQDNVFWHKTNAFLRLLLVKGYGNIIAEHYLVNEFPKSGGSWICQMLSDALCVPFPRNRLPLLRSSILHGHYLVDSGLKKKILVWRDGRDVAVSWFFHMIVGNNKVSKQLIQRSRMIMGVTDFDHSEIRRHFSSALRMFLEAPPYPRFTWAQFVEKWAQDSNVIHTKYEDFHHNPVAELQRLFFAVYGKELGSDRARDIVNRYSFSHQTQRRPGEEQIGDYLRKGIVGDWKNYFSDNDCEFFKKKAGAQLIKLDYETDANW